jgi:Ni,Fe-hydrogenase III component G
MNTQHYLERVESLLAPWTSNAERPAPDRIDVPLGAADLPAAVTALVEGGWGYLVAITGVDPGSDANDLWVLYHFAEGAAVATLRVLARRDKPEVPTIRHLIPLASMYEQELAEVLGVTVAGAPDIGRLFLPDDWPNGIYPLRKDFVIEQAFAEEETL